MRAAPSVRAILLDTGPLGLAANPQASVEGDACNRWIERQIAAGVTICVPEIADYEVRRELLQARRMNSVAALDVFNASLNYLPLDTDVMPLAAALWAQVRQAGQPTADRHTLDGDVILAAQALNLGLPTDEIVVATGNPGHLARFLPARLWSEINVY